VEIRKRFSDDIAILYVAGKIDINSAAIIEKTGELLKEGIKKILLNFANVNMIDYHGLSLLAIAYKNAVNQKGILKFSNVPGHLKELFKATRLDRTFEVYPDEAGALKTFNLSNKVDTLRLRRRFKRIDVSIPVKYKVGLSAAAKLLRGKILNLGGEGLYVYTKDTFPVSTELYMEMRVKHRKEPITLMGTVIWLADKELQPHSYPGMGIKLTGLDKKTQGRIIDFIDKNLTMRSRV
jgi:anti-anti-sigma factor